MKKKCIIMAKLCLALFLCVFIVQEASGPSMSDASFDDVSQEVVKTIKNYSLVKQNRQSVKRNLSINAGEYKNIEYYKSDDPMNVRELVIVEFKDPKQSKGFDTSLKSRIASQIKAFDGYGAEQVGLMKKAIVSIDMNYGFYIVCENANHIYDVYKEQL